MKNCETKGAVGGVCRRLPENDCALELCSQFTPGGDPKYLEKIRSWLEQNSGCPNASRLIEKINIKLQYPNTRSGQI